MPFIQSAIEDAKETKPVAEGEYTVRIHSAELELSKKGLDMVHVMCLVEGEENANPIHTYLILPTADYQHRAMALRNLKRFLVAFNIPHEGTGFDTDDFPGATANLLVQQEEVKEGAMKGEITNRLNLPKVKGEGEEEVESSSRRRA